MQTYWVAVEDTSTAELGDFGEVAAEDVQYLMAGYMVDLCRPAQIHMRDADDHNVVYDGVVYTGGFGYNLWVARKYREL